MANDTIKVALTQMAETVEAIKNDKPQVFPAAASAGDSVRQGDIYITKLDKLPTGAVKADKPMAQVAPGDTQGSRHVLSDLGQVEIYRLKNPGTYDGPIFKVKKGGVTLTHPEHGHWVLPENTIFAVTFQRTGVSEREAARVRD